MGAGHHSIVYFHMLVFLVISFADSLQYIKHDIYSNALDATLLYNVLVRVTYNEDNNVIMTATRGNLK